MPLEVVSRILRHSSIKITADVYAKVHVELTKDALGSLEKLLVGSGDSAGS